MLTDTHLHLQDIKDKGVSAEILSRAWDFDIHRFCCNSAQPADWPAVEEFARLDDRVMPFYGVHPWYAAKVASDWEKKLEPLLRNRDAGLGEIGLDRARETVPFEAQGSVFRRQLEIACHMKKPVAIHCVKAWGELLHILREPGLKPESLMIHSYHGSAEMLYELVRLGAYISFAWKWLRAGTPDMMELVRQVPEDRLLLETDFPYGEAGMQQAQGRFSSGEPSLTGAKYFECLQDTYRIAAQARRTDPETLEKAVWDNGTAFLSGASAR